MHRSAYLGFNVEFETHREYLPGDDLRHVNWKLYARQDRLFVKQYGADTNMNLYLLMDSSGSMACDHGPSTKWRYAARVAAAMALVAQSSRDAFGLIVFDEVVRQYLPPRVSRNHFEQVLATLASHVPSGLANTSEGLHRCQALCRRRGTVVLLSDLFDDEEPLIDQLAQLRSAGHEVIVVHVIDPWEYRLPAHGQYEFEDLETHRKVKVNLSSIQESYSQAVKAWEETIHERFVNAGIDWLTCRTDQPLAKLLSEFLASRSC